jgi:citrate lyase beta subunit
MQPDILADRGGGRVVAQNHQGISPAENKQKGVIVAEGRMVERLHLGMAERTVSIAEQIREMEMTCA